MGMSGVPPGSNARPARRRRTPVKPPSRWKLEHPTLSARMTKAQRDDVLRARAATGRKLGDLIHDGVRAAQQSYWAGYNDGYFRAMRDGLALPIPIVVPCRLCGALVTGDARDASFLQWVRQGANGGHPGCSGPTQNGPRP
jgi:hypothetical protein